MTTQRVTGVTAFGDRFRMGSDLEEAALTEQGAVRRWIRGAGPERPVAEGTVGGCKDRVRDEDDFDPRSEFR